MGAGMRRLFFVALLCSFAVPATAAQPQAASFDDITSFPYFAETARLEGAYKVADGIAFDIAGAARVWRLLSVRVGVTRVMRNTASETSGSFPHPFFFGANRTGRWSSESLDRSEVGVHVSAAWEIVKDPRFSASLFGGPSLFNFKQAVVDRVEVIQSYPYDTIDARLVTGSLKGSAIGFHAGVDLGWFFSRYVGVGGLVRFTRATRKDTRIGEGEPFDLDLGGAQGGAGIRLRF